LKPYFCYVHRTPSRPLDLTVIACDNDGEVPEMLDPMLGWWPGFTKIEVYDEDRCVLVRHAVAA
jgi:hypothetical protein